MPAAAHASGISIYLGSLRSPTLSASLNICLLPRLAPSHIQQFRVSLLRQSSLESAFSPSLSASKLALPRPLTHCAPITVTNWSSHQHQHDSNRRSINTSPSMERNGNLHKRKTSPVILDRPTKHFRPGAYEDLDGDLTPNDTVMNGTFSDAEPTEMLPATATQDTAEWQATIEKVVRNVVSIHFCQTCSFDTDPATSSEATGFVVDAQRGYILTNRHVVGAGPFWGYCIFDNHEEVGYRGQLSFVAS